MSHHEAFEQLDSPTYDEHAEACRICSSQYSQKENPSSFGICNPCWSRIMIVLLFLMVIASCMAWFSTF
jgi:hypothetical protein